MIGNSNDGYNFPYKLLNIAQVLRLSKTFANNSSANTKLLTTQWNKIGQSGEFLGRRLEPLLKSGLPLRATRKSKTLF